MVRSGARAGLGLPHGGADGARSRIIKKAKLTGGKTL